MKISIIALLIYFALAVGHSHLPAAYVLDLDGVLAHLFMGVLAGLLGAVLESMG